MIWRQPPVHSPVDLGDLLGALGATLFASGAREALSALLAERYSAGRVILTAAGTQALQLALECALDRVGRGVERTVAMPAYSCYDLVTAAVGASARVRFYDVDPTTLAPDLDSLRKMVAEGVHAVVTGNLYGFPVDVTAVREIVASSGALVIEDAAQGMGASGSGGEAGSQGDLSILSFGRGKGWTGGGGGALLARGGLEQAWAPDQMMGARAAALDKGGAGFGRFVVTAAAWLLGRPSLYGLPSSIPALGLGETHWRDPEAPRAIPSFSAALAVRTAGASRAAVEGRRRRAASLRAVVREAAPAGGTSFGLPQPIGGDSAAGYLRCPMVAASASKAVLLRERGRHLGVGAGYPTALHRLPQASAVMEGTPHELPGAVELAERLVTLPTHRWVGPWEVEAMRALVSSP